MKPWEDMIALNHHGNGVLETLGPARDYRDADRFPVDWSREIGGLLEEALEKDAHPLPDTGQREGYYGGNHFSYWASGLRDFKNLMGCCDRQGVEPAQYLDFGCASGRVLRHFAINHPQTTAYGCDINRAHVEWIARYLPASIVVFQNHSIPVLPLPDNTFDLISAFSVFTHIEAFETTWLMELRRILKPGGLAWITIHSEKTWEEMEANWPLYKALVKHPEFDTSLPRPPMNEDRRVFRSKADASYSSNVFYRLDYIKRVWGRIFEVAETHRRPTTFQDVVVLRKS